MSDTEIAAKPPVDQLSSNPEIAGEHAVDKFPNNPDIVSEIIMWRRKEVNIAILVVATGTWVVMEVYEYSFIALVCYAIIAFLACCFFWGNMHRFLKREAPELSELEIKEETAVEYAQLFKQRAEQAIRWLVHVSAEREWFVFAGVALSLYLISQVALYLDLVTVWYIGIVGGMSVPVVYVKNEERMREMGETLRMKTQHLKGLVKDKMLKVVGKKKKQV